MGSYSELNPARKSYSRGTMMDSAMNFTVLFKSLENETSKPDYAEIAKVIVQSNEIRGETEILRQFLTSPSSEFDGVGSHEHRNCTNVELTRRSDNGRGVFIGKEHLTSSST